MSQKQYPTAPLVLRLANPSLLFTKDFDKSRKMFFADKSTFVVSTGRTGTKFIAELLQQLPSVKSLQEPYPSYMLQAWTSAYLEGKTTDHYMRRIFKAKRGRIARSTQESLYVESNHFLNGFVSHIDQIVESPTIIHVVRDPRSFITSMINRGNDSGLKLLFNKVVPYFAYAEPGYKRISMSPIEREACHWIGMNRHLSEYGKKHPANYHFFRFEDIFQSDKALLPVLQAIGLSSQQIKQLDTADVYRNPSRRTGKKAFPSWRKWSKQDCQLVDRLCGEYMYAYGYGTEPEWQAKIE